jgi:hypothetical protein
MAIPNAYRMFATGCVMGTATVLRAGLGCVELWTERVPPLMKLGEESLEGKPDAARAEGHFRDELIAIARESSDIALRELRRGVEDLDAFTRPEEERASRAERPYRAKP